MSIEVTFERDEDEQPEEFVERAKFIDTIVRVNGVKSRISQDGVIYTYDSAEAQKAHREAMNDLVYAVYLIKKINRPSDQLAGSPRQLHASRSECHVDD